MQKKAAKLALQAYKDDIKGALKIENKLTSTVAFVKIEDDCQYVVFRGTNSLGDWLFNLSALPAYYNRRWTHAGFALAHKSVWKRIKRLLDPGKKTLVTGHSLGGALSELTAWACRDFVDLSMICFGKPRVFVRGSKKRMNHKDQISYVAHSDVVTRVPRLGFEPDRNQDLIYFDSSNKVFFNPTRYHMKKDFCISQSISDHSMNSYEKMVNDLYLDVAQLRYHRKPF
tara:strand:+ start:926 stop:1609 length:684 start_codon:yes stop_codon:yes gene_type:complete